MPVPVYWQITAQLLPNSEGPPKAFSPRYCCELKGFLKRKVVHVLECTMNPTPRETIANGSCANDGTRARNMHFDIERVECSTEKNWKQKRTRRLNLQCTTVRVSWSPASGTPLRRAARRHQPALATLNLRPRIASPHCLGIKIRSCMRTPSSSETLVFRLWTSDQGWRSSCEFHKRDIL